MPTDFTGGTMPSTIRWNGGKPSVASLRSRSSDPGDHDEPIWLITIAEIRITSPVSRPMS